MGSLKSTFEGESMSSLRWVGGAGLGAACAFGEFVNFRRFCILAAALPLEIANMSYFFALFLIFVQIIRTKIG